MKSRDWWEGDGMFNNGFDPYAELQQLRLESVNQRNLINQLITNNNKLQDLLMELSNQHQSIATNYKTFNHKLATIKADLEDLRKNTLVFSNDLDADK